MTWWCLGTLLSHWKRNPLQLFAFLAGLALATALWSGVQAINAEARASYDAAAATLGEGQFDQLLPVDGDRIPQETYVGLRRAGWLVSPVIEGEIADVRLLGIDPVTAPAGFGGLGADGVQGVFALQEGPSLVARAETAAALDGVADVVVDPNIAPGIAVGDIGTVQRLLERRDLSRLVVLPGQPLIQRDLGDVAPALERQASIQTADVGELTDSFHLNLTAFGLLSFAVGLFIVHSTIGLAFEQRRGVLRTLRALGVPLRTLLGLMTLEILLLAFIGASLGILLGYVIAAALLPDVAATLRGLYGANVSGTLALRPEWWLSGFLIAILGTAAALGGRIWQTARMPILAGARPRAWITGSTSRRRQQAWAGLLLLGVALVLAVTAEGLIAGFALLGTMLIGAALLLPVIGAVLTGFFEARAGTAEWSWFWADTRQQLPGLGLALMALLLAVSANIGVSTMVSSFRLTFVGFLDQRLAPELFIQVDDEATSAALQANLAARGLEVLPLRAVEAEIAGQPARLFGIRVSPTYREDWVLLDAGPGAWDRVAAGQAVVLNEQLARRADLWVGADVPITPSLTLPVAGVVGDYGNPRGQVVLSETVFETLHPEIYPRQFGVRTEDAATLRADLKADLGLSENAMIDQAAIKEASLAVFERTFVVTSALNVLTLGVAGFAMLMSLLTLADLRVPQLAPVWAMGLTRRRLGRLELLRAVALAGLVFLCAVPVGLALAWVLLSVVNVAAFGWQLPMFLFPGDYALLGLYAVVAAVLAAAWPAVRLMRTPPSSLLKVFANER